MKAAVYQTIANRPLLMASRLPPDRLTDRRTDGVRCCPSAQVRTYAARASGSPLTLSCHSLRSGAVTRSRGVHKKRIAKNYFTDSTAYASFFFACEKCFFIYTCIHIYGTSSLKDPEWWRETSGRFKQVPCVLRPGSSHCYSKQISFELQKVLLRICDLWELSAHRPSDSSQ